MKLARVNLEAESFADPRFAQLERLLGLPAVCGGKLALARCAVIWSWQTEHYTPEEPCFVVPEEVIEMALEVDGPAAIAALVRARLAELTPDGVRMKGSDHERTGWLYRLRNKSRAGVAAKKDRREARNSKRDDNSQPVVDPRSTTGEPEVNPLSSGFSVPEIPDLTHAASDPTAEDKPAVTDRFAQIAANARTRVDQALRGLMAELGAPSFPKARVGDLEVDQLAVRAVAGWAMSEPERDPAVVVNERIEHLIRVRSAAARATKSVIWWASSTFWKPENLERDLMQRPGDAARSAAGRSGARFAQDRGPTPLPAVGKGPAPVVVPAAERAAAAAALVDSKRALGIVDGVAKKLGGQR